MAATTGPLVQPPLSRAGQQLSIPSGPEPGPLLGVPSGRLRQDRPDILDRAAEYPYNPATRNLRWPVGVPRRGLEPLPPSGEPILSRPRLPVPPPRHVRSASVSILP